MKALLLIITLISNLSLNTGRAIVIDKLSEGGHFANDSYLIEAADGKHLILDADDLEAGDMIEYAILNEYTLFAKYIGD